MGIVSKPIFAKLAKRFQIRQESAESLRSGDVLVPVTDADDFVREPKFQTTSSTTTGRTDTYTVPLGKTWRVLAINAARANAGDNFIYVSDGTIEPILAYNAASTNLVWNTFPLRVGEGKSIKVQMSAGTSGALVSNIYYLEEDS